MEVVTKMEFLEGPFHGCNTSHYAGAGGIFYDDLDDNSSVRSNIVGTYQYC